IIIFLYYSISSFPSSPSFFFTDPAPTDIYTLSLHDALPISAPVWMPQPSGPSSSSGASSRTFTVLRSCAIAYVANEDCAKNRSCSVGSPSPSVSACDPSGRCPAKLPSLKVAQLAGDPSKHGRHCAQLRKLSATWSPGATLVTADPTASTTPAPSWPSTTGSGTG